MISLNEELESFKCKYNTSNEKICELESKIKQILNKSQNEEDKLRQEIDTLKEDRKYQRDEFERLVDNLRIKFD